MSRVIRAELSSEIAAAQKRQGSQIGSGEVLFIPTKSNEDMWFVSRLFKHKQEWNISLAPKAESQRWTIEELFSESPVGVYHLMRSMDDDLRERVLRYCPEAKRLFPASHIPVRSKES